MQMAQTVTEQREIIAALSQTELDKTYQLYVDLKSSGVRDDVITTMLERELARRQKGL
jgi:hypothetical protein